MEKIFVGMLICISFSALDCSSQTNYTWNSAAASSSWSTPANWVPSGVPTAADNVVIGNSINLPAYDGVQAIKNFTINAGTFNLGGNTLVVKGTATFNGGTVSNGTINPSGTSVTFTNTTFNCNVNASCADVLLNGGVFNNPSVIEKTGGSNNSGTGGITYNAAVELKNRGSGYLLTGSTAARNDIFNAPLTLTVASTGALYVAYNSLGTQFNDNIVVNSTGKGYTYIGTSATTGTSVLAAAKTITAGNFLRGGLRLSRFTQVGNTPQTITLAGDSSYFLLEGNAVFNGSLNASASYISTLNSTFNGVTTFEKTGAINYNVSGGNTFNATAKLIQSGAGNWIWGNSFPDIFNADVTLINKGTEFLNIANSHAAATPTQFNGNIIVNSYGSNAKGIAFSGGTGTCVLAAGKTITIGTDGFSAGELSLRHFTQTGNTAQTLTTFDNNASIKFLTGTTFDGDVTIKAPHVFLSGATCNRTATFENTANTLSNGAGGNIFNGVTTLTKSGLGYFMTGQYSADVFNDDLYLNNNNDGYIYLAYTHSASPATLINGNLIVSSTPAVAASGIIFGGTATAATVLAAGKKIIVAPAGITAGSLTLKNFTQIGSTSQNIALTGTAILNLSSNNIFNGAVNFKAPGITVGQTIFNDTVVIEKTGTGTSTSYGGNTFNEVTSITLSGDGALQMGQYAADIFNKDLTVNNFNSDQSIAFALSHPAALPTQLNGNVVVNSTGTNTGILFGSSTGAVTLAAGKAITIGASGFSAGTLQLRNFTQLGSTAQNITLTGSGILAIGPSSIFNAAVNFIAPGVNLSSTTYAATAYFEKTGSMTSTGSGNNIFNGATTIVNAATSTNYFRNSGGNVFNAGVTFTNNSTSDILFENTSGNTFNGTVTYNNNSSLNMRVAYSGTTVFNNDIIVTATSGTGIIFCESASATATLSAGKTITIGPAGYSSGPLQLQRFTQLGNTPQALTLTNTATLLLGAATTFNGEVNFKAPGLTIRQTTFNDIVVLEKTGAGTNTSYGGNTFNEVTSITVTGAGALQFGQTLPDVFNKDLTVNNFNSGQSIYFGYSHPAAAPTQLNGNVIINSTGTSTGISFGRTTATAVLAAGKTISIGSSGFSAGTLRLRYFTQLGTTAQNLTLTGSAILTLGPSSVFDAPVSFTAPGVNLNGATYNSTAYFEKTGAASTAGTGANVFNGVTTIVHAATSSSYFRNNGSNTFNAPVTFTNNAASDILFENTLGSTYNAPVTFNNYSTSNIRVSFLGATVFNDNITLNCPSGTGILFSESGTATATLSAGKTIAVGPSGFSSGQLLLQRFTQSGTAAQAIALGNTALLQVGPASTFNGNVNFTAPQLMLNGCTYNGTAYLEKTGATSNTGTGNNTFNGAATLVNSNNSAAVFRTNGNNTFNASATFTNTSTGDVLFELAAGSTYNGDVTINNSGTSSVRPAYTGNTAFNGNIIINNTGGGVSFGEATAAVVTMAAGKTITTPGFNAGAFNLYHFTQLGSTAQNIVLTGSSTFTLGNASTFNGDATITAPGVVLNGVTFNGIANITKNGSAVNSSNGGNVFNGAATITSSGIGSLTLAAASADDFNADATFVRTGAGTFSPANNANCTFAGNLSTAGSTGIVTFSTAGSGRVTFDGSASQAINGSASFPPEFYRISVNKAAGALQLNVPVNITTSVNFIKGQIVSSSANLINFRDNAVVTGASHASFINGPVRKTGNDAFTFPVGKGSFYRPIGITAPGTATDHFTAEYFETSANSLYSLSSKAPAIDHLSVCEYWILNRTNGASNVFVNLSWENYGGTACSGVNNLNDILVARWNGASWVNHGKGTVTGTTSQGTVNTLAAVTSFSPFALGSSTPFNPFPITLLDFYAEKETAAVQLKWRTATESNNDYFTVERSLDGTLFKSIGEVKGAGNSVATLNYNLYDEQPAYGKTNYYRLKQTDYDGKSTYSTVISVNASVEKDFVIYPNPVEDNIVRISYNPEDKENGSVYVTNMLGQTIYRQALSTAGSTEQGAISIDLSFAGKGIYTVHLVNGSKQYMQKLVVR